ncbi:DUF6949 family protein [Hoeflea olei]|uniref:Uncharacterized protein n=1 Tax=Hoeflea olei TaxID=1480615 RepID=A0A1C1YZ91_9HYPH|nr:hypothetical protein [Hoeflea olei]OCW58818.1 hypothetical protein AWJ14_20750 [Hoeflea olei]
MIDMPDILTAFSAMVTGFATSWAGLEIARLAGWREPVQADAGIGDGLGAGGPARLGGELALAAMLGPRLLLANGYRNWREGALPLPLYGVLALVAAGWSMCSGVLVLELAFASGFFMV